jgi:hypothetical protein
MPNSVRNAKNTKFTEKVSGVKQKYLISNTLLDVGTHLQLVFNAVMLSLCTNTSCRCVDPISSTVNFVFFAFLTELGISKPFEA